MSIRKCSGENAHLFKPHGKLIDMGLWGPITTITQEVLYTLLTCSIVDVGEILHRSKANALSITPSPCLIGQFPEGLSYQRALILCKVLSAETYPDPEPLQPWSTKWFVQTGPTGKRGIMGCSRVHRVWWESIFFNWNWSEIPMEIQCTTVHIVKQVAHKEFWLYTHMQLKGWFEIMWHYRFCCQVLEERIDANHSLA